MSWAVGFDDRWDRDIGYGVPAYCDHPDCGKQISCNQEPYGGEFGCGRYFCDDHQEYRYNEDEEQICAHLDSNHTSIEHPDWIHHKLTDESWQQWRDENPDKVGWLSGLRHLVANQEGVTAP